MTLVSNDLTCKKQETSEHLIYELMNLSLIWKFSRDHHAAIFIFCCVLLTLNKLCLNLIIEIFCILVSSGHKMLSDICNEQDGDKLYNK